MTGGGDEIMVHGPERLRLAYEQLADECGRLCCQLGITPALRAAWDQVAAEPVPQEMTDLVARLGGETRQ